MGITDMVLAVFLVCFFGGLLLYGLIGWAAKRAVKYIRRRRMRVCQIKLRQNKTAPQRQLSGRKRKNNPCLL